MESHTVFLLLALLLATSLQLVVSQKYLADKRIVNGTPTSIKAVPFHVHFQFHGATELSYCGGAILSHFWVMTAGHCVVNRENPKKYKVWVGTEKSPLFVREVTPLNVSLVVLHPEYLTPNPDYVAFKDIALLRMSQPLKYSDKIQPIDLPLTNEETMFSRAYIMGFGPFKNGVSPRVLLSGRIDLKDTPRCRSKVQKLLPKSLFFKRSGFICHMKKIHEICKGDSGSPLVAIRDDGSYVAIGINSISNNIMCGPPVSSKNIFTLFTRVSTYRWWIRRTMRKYDKIFASYETNRPKLIFPSTCGPEECH